MRELKIYHPNTKGTGACLRVTHAECGDSTFSVYPQRQSKGMVAPGFNWDDGVLFIADWSDLAKMLMVFRGECESLEDGRGLSYTHDAGWSKLMLRHVIEPVHCYVLEIYEKRDGVESRGIFTLSIAEALALSLIFEGVLHHTLIGGVHEQV